MEIDIYYQIERLLRYGLEKGLITVWDMDYTRNRILEVLELPEARPTDADRENLDFPVDILQQILDWSAANNRLIENNVTYRDLLDTKIMGCLTARPSEVIRGFNEIYSSDGAEKATKDFYQFSKAVHYIRTDRIAKNEQWDTSTDYGDLEITINLSKPEKDPKEIASARKMQQSFYPDCLLCKENVGYEGRFNHPARQNLRVIPVELDDKQWFMQFSPYVYYEEHAIIFSGAHEPMKITRGTFNRLLEFVEKMPHYFIGSNADLPIVGGSILTHDHYQGGKHEFPMAKAEVEREFKLSTYPGVKMGIVKWPMSVVRIQSKDRGELADIAVRLLDFWKSYSDKSVDIFAYSDDSPHNTITPIARRRDGLYELDLVLRNNRTNEDHPLGIFHPHEEVHHIKKENIGLIEVMGLAVLPGRLKDELKTLGDCLVENNGIEKVIANEEIAKHAAWAEDVVKQHPEINQENVLPILREEVGRVFAIVLSHAGVFKRNEEGQQAFGRFMEEFIQTISD
ncbi:UDP-glucose--hexose-1-phosphate uridylyltransferase [Pseudalkalibacillus caeni]|uniref:Galactose-1-phosphate uridylyltransferase n=1 Tax=Exobacillus caeni TaxID=2574798 RepID=A0A5R9F5T8_9BACL|nr:UDP-glucose--hexose-1-phosphate uridylyltransferase [Pseudalkalibacillus caeni]TLS38411.1 UDP-glucose--hexose-1-phosphate uridylyltransferase [Pseudalkalibacillus caeni]